MLNGDFVRVLVCCEIPIANVANINLGLNEIMVTSPHINLLVFFLRDHCHLRAKLHSHTHLYDSWNQKKGGLTDLLVIPDINKHQWLIHVDRNTYPLVN